ncbi:MAG: endonuclease/exonuclease/phosphatase family protein [Thermoguttaceae bacterium]|nr:endonuclease/exonuclease/phosphatase family protein [Thermoguttaceae bacterium]
MKKVLSILAAALCAFGAFALPSKADDGFKAMSFNIRCLTDDDKGDNHWDKRKSTLVEVIKEADPVTLGVQEATWPQMEYLIESLPEYGWVGVGRDDGKKAGEFMTVFYKKDAVELLDSGTFWLSQTPDKPSKGWDAACRRTVTWTKLKCKKTGAIFVCANTHFDHVGTIARKEAAKLIQRRMTEFTENGKYPYYVSGDFNVTAESDAYKTITSENDGIPGLFDSNKIAKTHDIAQACTYQGYGTVPPDKGSIIDFIFVNDKLEVENFKINPYKHTNGFFASDHCSIVATLKIKD